MKMKMEDRVVTKDDIESQLQKEQSALNSLKETMQKSDQLTKGMTGILTSFEDRLAILEKTTLPVYNDTVNLQRTQENIQNTLGALDNIIRHYNVSKNVQETIREGWITSLENYLDSLASVKEAIKYFEENNRNSTELHHLTALFQSGGEALEREFRLLLNRYCKPIAPVVILDLIGTDGELGADEGRASVEQLPARAVHELTGIADWLLKHNREEYMQVYANFRSTIVQQSLQGLKDYQKSSSGGSMLAAPHGSPALSRSRLKDTPTRKTSRRFQQALMKRATHTVLKYSQSVEQATGLPIGHRRQGSMFEFRDDNLDLDVEYYLTSITALYKLMQTEKKLMTAVIPVSKRLGVFVRIFQASMDSVIQEGDSIAMRAKKNSGKQDFSSMLYVFAILKHLNSVRPEFEIIFKDCKEILSSKFDALTQTLHSTGRRSLDEFIENIRNDQDRQLPKDGTVHEMTSNTMIFLEQILDFVDTMGGMLAKDPTFQNQTVNLKESDRNSVCMAIFIIRVLSTLGLTLVNKSDWYSDPYMKAIFRLNNLHYILKSLQRTGILEITKLHNQDLEDHYLDQILDQKRLYSQSWSRVLHYVLEVDRNLPPRVNHVYKLKDKDRQIVKDKFTGFNKEMDDIYKVQKGYAIPSAELRESLKQENRDFILPRYQEFYDKYVNMPFTKHKEKYIRFTPAAINHMMDRFFDVAA